MNIIAGILACVGFVYCNTEILKLPRVPSLELPVEPSPTWSVISTLPGHNSRLFQIHPVPHDEDSKNSSATLPHDLWVVLEIDEWRADHTPPVDFTLRLSWPASMAIDFNITVFGPSASRLGSESTVKPTNVWCQYVRLRAYSAGLRVPRDPAGPIFHEIAQFNLIVEPLLWGVIPRSIVPTLLFIFAVAGLSSCMVPRMLARLQHVAEEARVEAEHKRQ